MQNNNVLYGNLINALIKLALPLFALNLLNSLYGVVDTYFVGKIGELAVGSVSLITPIMWCAMSVAMGLSAGAISIISYYVGASNSKKASHFATEIIYFCFLFAIVLSAVTFVFSRQILDYLKTPEEIYENAYIYLRVIAFDYIGLFLLNVYMAIRQACGDSKSGVMMSAIASILNVVLDPVFIFMLHMDVKGAAIATVLSKWIVLPFLFHSLLNKRKVVYISFKEFDFNKEDALHIMKLSIPSAFGQFLEALGFVIMNKYIVFYGATAISAYGIGEKLTNLYNIPIISFCNILPTFIGQNLGANQLTRAKNSYWTSMLTTIVLAILLFGFGMAIMKPSIYLFVPDASDKLVSMCETFVFYSLVMGPFVAWYFNICGVFNGSGHTNISFILSICRLWGTRLPIILLFFYFTDLGIVGIWLAMLLSNLIVGVIGQILYFKYPWIHSKANTN